MPFPKILRYPEENTAIAPRSNPMDLVIGYGNTLRNDDGVGPAVAERVATWAQPQIQVLAIQQLTPELAAEIATAHQVIFVDAIARDLAKSPEVQWQPLTMATDGKVRAHHSDPASLLALSYYLFGTVPPARWLLIPGEDFGFGDRFSPLAQSNMETALQQLAQLLPSPAATTHA